MAKKKEIIDARADSKGNITKVRFKGNSSFTNLETAMRMVERGQVEGAHVVEREGAKKHLRTNPNHLRKDNLDDMAGV